MKMTSEKRRKIIALIITLITVAAGVAVSIALSKRILVLFRDPEVFRTFVREKGWGARFLFIGLMTLQVVMALIPGEPMEIAAGLAFGAVEGTLLCMAGIALGSTLIFLLVKKWGMRYLELFFSPDKIRSLRFLQNTRRAEILLFIFMLIPGTPKDLLSFIAPLTDMKLGYWIVLTTIARIPSIVTSTVGGNALGEQRYVFASIVFGVSLVVSIGGMLVYEKLRKEREKKKEEKESNHTKEE